MKTIHENLDYESKEKVCKAAKKRMKTIHENLDNEAKAKVVAKKRMNTIYENLDDKVKEKRSCLKVIRKENKRFMKILMMKA